jgi:hypothetical protein
MLRRTTLVSTAVRVDSRSRASIHAVSVDEQLREGERKSLMSVRRVVTAHDADGKAVFASDEHVPPIIVALLPGLEFHRLGR